MPKKEVSFLDYGPVEGCDIDCHNCTRKCTEKVYSYSSYGESGWRDFINGLPCIMVTPMGLLVAFVLAQGDTAWSFLIWGGLIGLSLLASDMFRPQSSKESAKK